MNHDEVTDIISKIKYVEKDYEIFFWVGLDGIFHDTENPNPKDELICCCGISYSTETGDWIVTPWLYNMDSPGVFKTAESACKMSFFWLNWMGYIYGDGIEEPRFEADWLSIKSNRTVIEMLFDHEGENFKNELLKEEKTIDE